MMQAEQEGYSLPINQFNDSFIDHYGDGNDIFAQLDYCFDPHQQLCQQQSQQWQPYHQQQQLKQQHRHQQCTYSLAGSDPTALDNGGIEQKKTHESAYSAEMSEWCKERAPTLHYSMTSYVPYCFDKKSDRPLEGVSRSIHSDHHLDNKRRSRSSHHCGVRDEVIFVQHI